uniref:Glycosyltransferase n=1 Tax=Ignisphaera aggregans TaxID=334771 RepID=A0A7J3QEU7_9CREN
MIIAMVNDCAYVGETIARYLPEYVIVKHIKRSRSLWDKTMGIAYKLLRVSANIYHIHYLLQDCYIALRLGKRPLIGHAHGSDVRVALSHPLLDKVVRYNLMKCDRILASTPDILNIAKQFREDVEYLPNPVDTKIFYPKPIQKSEKKKVLIASSLDWDVKGTDIAIKALSRIKSEIDVNIIAYGKDLGKTLKLAKNLDIHVNILPKVPHEKLNQYYWSSDVVIDQFKLGSLGMVSLEAIACGRPVITYVSSEYPEYRDFPLKDLVNEEEIAEAVINADEMLWRKEYEYMVNNHSPEIITSMVMNIYSSLLFI